jgi:3-hydroxymyristoyl/3-hydroxydecanoyl-(acyl carrier protein) dehydratase
VLQVEAMNQTALLALRHAQPGAAGVPFIFALDKIKFRRPVVPGDQLLVDAQLAPADGGRTKVTATVHVAGQLASEAELTIGFLTDDNAFRPRHLAPPLRPHQTDGGLDIEGIMAAIPHRFPFLLIDRILRSSSNETGTEGSFTVLKNITLNEPIFSAFAGLPPFLPSYLVPEIAAQSGCAYVLSLPQHKGKIGYFMSIDNGVFTRPILPGDQMLLETTMTIRRERFGNGTAVVYVGEEQVASCEIKFTLVANS